MNKINILFLIIFIFFGCKTNTHTIILNQNPGKKIPENSQIQTRTKDVAERYFANSGAEYIIEKQPLTGFNNNKPDNIAVIEIGAGQYARLDNKEGVYPLSWFGEGDDSEIINKALSYLATIPGKGKLLLDRSVTLKKTIYIPKGTELDGGHIYQSNTGDFRPTITADLRDKSKSLIEFVPTKTATYNNALIRNVKIIFVSEAKSALHLIGPIGNFENIFVLGNNYIQNGIEFGASMFCVFNRFYISGANNAGFYMFRNPAFVGTTLQIENSNSVGNKIGIIVEDDAVRELNIINTTFELLKDGIAIIGEKNEYIKFDRIYTENIGTELKTQFLFQTKSSLIINNSSITGSRYNQPIHKTTGIKATTALYINCFNTWFNGMDQVIEKTGSVKAVNFVNCSEGSIKDQLTDQINSNSISLGGNTNVNLVNHTTLNGTTNNMNIQSLKATRPVLYANGSSGITISQASSPTTFTNIYPDYGQQDGELVIVPGGKTRAATFGTNGGITIGSTLTSSPPVDGIRVIGQGIFGQGEIQRSAALQVESKDKGFLPPRLSTQQRDGILMPVAGLIIFNSTVNKHQGFDGKNWNNLY